MDIIIAGMLRLSTQIAKYPLTLNYIKNNFNRPRNMLVHHGLMGNAKNFRNITKNSHISAYVNSYLIDCRNHGASPHTETNSIEDLADDIMGFIREHGLAGRLVLMGHSLGAMALMKFTEKYHDMQDQVDRVVLVDINCLPRKEDRGIANTQAMLKQMYKIDLNQDLKTVHKQIEQRALTKDIAGLLKTNIEILGERKNRWIPNLEVLLKQFHYLIDFTHHPNKWRKPVEVIYGAKSIHVNPAQIEKYKEFYPQMKEENFHRIEDAGHWVHFDNTSLFLKTMQKILQKDQ